MNREIDLKAIHSRIREIKSAAEKLGVLGGNFPALERNTARILASLNMLELNISDLIDLPEAATDE